jgi:mycothiol synthase
VRTKHDLAMAKPGLAVCPYESETDLHRMLDMLIEARSKTSDWRYAHVGELLWSFFMVACHLDPREHIRLWHDGEGRLVGYAMLGEDPSFDWQILPAHEWRGIEWAESLVSELRKRDPALWGGPLVSGAREDNAARIAFLEKHGFRLGGEFSEVNLIRSFDGPLPESEVPSGYTVRSIIAPGDIPSRAAAHREVWKPWTVGNVTDDDYAAFVQLPGYDRDLDVVAVAPDGTIASYVNGWLDSVNRIGDLGPVGALPAHRRRGLTRAVLAECLRRMKARGMERVCVSTGVSNEAARVLYESLGFRIVNRYLEYVKSA